jgi:hypothetical protein
MGWRSSIRKRFKMLLWLAWASAWWNRRSAWMTGSHLNY